MWEDQPEESEPLLHDMECPRCGHALHAFLACGGGCHCPPTSLPGQP
jgi:hypothetical protein